MTRPRRAFESEPGDADPAATPVPRRSSGFLPAAEPYVEAAEPSPEADEPPPRPRRALPALAEPSAADTSDEPAPSTAAQAAVRRDGEHPPAEPVLPPRRPAEQRDLEHEFFAMLEASR